MSVESEGVFSFMLSGYGLFRFKYGVFRRRRSFFFMEFIEVKLLMKSWVDVDSVSVTLV